VVKWMFALLALAAVVVAPAALTATPPAPTAPPAVVPPRAADKAPPAVAAKVPAATPKVEKPEKPPAREPPPINIGALREEIQRSSTRENQPGADREKLEKLAADINKAREALREETARLETLLAKRDSSPATSAAGEGTGAGSGGELPEGGKKVPTSLDGLAKAMRGMKPELAAPIISRVDRKMAADVLQRMPATDAGKVLGQCKPEVAAELATEIASRTPRSELKR
jgi:flagellar motility protein MotE (MotC chaperone)